jgi:hypothetical protein
MGDHHNHELTEADAFAKKNMIIIVLSALTWAAASWFAAMGGV